ncbi:MAG: MFS transporter [Acutalibacteraceae bacterium]|jgi:Na+/melibiose symporter-like transporter
MAEKMKLDVKKTLLIGFGFMASSIAWAIYDPYVSKLLSEKLTDSTFIFDLGQRLAERVPFLTKLMEAQGEDVSVAGGGFTLVPLFVGIIMTFDNIFGVIFQPFFGKLSDHTHTRFGKRRPFIFVGAPIAAILFILIPHMQTVPALMAVVILFVFVMSTWRAPVVALMPDLTPPALRSEGNAIINLTGGIGGLIGMFAGTMLCMIFGFDSKQNEERPYVFLLGATVMILGTLVLAFFVKEPDSRLEKRAEYASGEFDKEKAKKKEKEKLKQLKLSKPERRSLLFMLAGLFFLFAGANSIQTFFALFADEILGKTTAQATLMLGVFGLASMASAIPAGKLGTKFGRKKMILSGLIAFIVMFGLYAITKQMWLIWPALVVGGAANMFITVNTLPLVLEIGGIERVGTFTGYYYTATFSAQVAAPIAYGIVRVLSGTYMSLFVFCPIAFALSLLCISQVRHGEAIPAEVIKEAEMQGD